MQAPKANLEDAELGKVLWIQDHGGWRAIVVQAVVPSAKGPKIFYHNFYDRAKGECLLRDCYRATHS